MKINIKIILIFLFSFFLTADSHSYRSVEKIAYRIIYIIHGDGDYLFHDREGNSHDADLKILNEALDVAANSTAGEVFIFYQKKREHFLFFFPKDDGNFYHYKNGLLETEGSYSRKDAQGLEIESEIFSKYSAASDSNIKNFFLYYGHEIPAGINKSYHASYPDKIFNLKILTKGIQNFTATPALNSEKFDLVVLSTCKNGTIDAISSLSPFTNFLIASPEDLHLSHLNSESLKNINNQDEINIYNFCEYFAEKSFNELTEATNTVVTVSLYDMSNFRMMSSAEIKEKYCGNSVANLSGIKSYYRAPLFGKDKNKISHPGIKCPDELDISSN
jgi:hypothetical protein